MSIDIKHPFVDKQYLFGITFYRLILNMISGFIIMVHSTPRQPVFYELRLYIAGDSERSRAALDNLQKVCDEYLKDQCHIEVIDIKEHPELAARKEIFAIPTLVKELPLPLRKLIGDLHATEKVLVGLDIRHRHATR